MDINNLRVQTVKKVPLRSTALDDLFKKYKEDLYHDCVYQPTMAEIKSISNNLDLPKDVSCILNDDNNIAMLCWMMDKVECRKKFAQFLMNKPWKWKETLGPIRDQMYHLLCWCYAACDLVTGLLKRVRNEEYFPLSTWHMCAYCNPSSLGKDKRAREGHHCYGLTTENGIIYIQFCGGHQQIAKEFDCKQYHPPLGHASIKKGRVKSRPIRTLEEALRELKYQPVGADLIHYGVLFVNGARIYYGPNQRHSDSFKGYHSVIMMGVTEMNGELVVICKLSNGQFVGDSGYVYVSLATLYIPVGVKESGRESVRGSSTPLHLLTNFVVPELIMNDDKKHVDKRQRHDDEKEDKKKKDEKEEDNRKTKRPRLSKPTTGRYGSSSSSSSSSRRTGTHQRRRSLHPEEELNLNQGYGRNASFRENHVAGGFRPSRPVSNRGRNFVGPRANRDSGPSGVGNGKAQVDVAVSVEKGLVEEHPPAKSSFASVISAEPVAKALEPVNVPEPNKLQPFTFGRQDTWEQVTENGNASNEVKDQSVLKADVGERSNVTFPFHIQAAKKLQNGLTFGSFASDFVKEVKINGKKRISRGVSKDSQSPKTRQFLEQDEKGMRQNDCKEKKKSG